MHLRAPCAIAPTRLAIAIAWALACASSAAAPNGATVVAGQASISSAGKTLTVTNTPGTIIQWQGFSIAADELTRFIQQGPSSAVLNRVVGQDPSLLLGKLQSNGRVFLVNPNGITFGAGARVDVAGLVASTLGLSDADFLAGRLRFAAGPRAGGLTQLGTIVTEAGGQVVLVAPSVDNGGVVVAPGGQIVLAAGQKVQLADSATPELRVSVDATPGEVVNVGELVADGGRIGIHAGLIRHDGSIRADRAERGPGGEVLLRGATIALGSNSVTSASAGEAGSGGKVVVVADGATTFAGRIAARGGAAGGDGGFVEVSGKETLAFAGAVDTSAAHGRTGTLLLDPSDITISSGANASISAGPGYTGSAATSNLNVATLQAALASNNVVVDTTSASASAGNINVNNAVTWASGNSLELRAHNNITVGATITAAGAGALRLVANQDGVGGGDVSVNAALTAHTGGIALSGVNVNSTAAGTLTTRGGPSQNGGNVTVAATGSVNLAGAIVTSGGNASVGGVAGGTAGTIDIRASGGAVTAAALTAVGGNALSGNADGGNGASVTLDAGGAAPTITLGGNVTTTGGTRTGTGIAGAGGSVLVADAALINVGALTVNARGGNAGVGVGGAVRFAGALDSTGAARSLTVTSNDVTRFDGAVGGASPLSALSLNGGGTTVLSGGAVVTTGAQTYANALLLGAHTSLDAGAGNLVFSSTIDGPFDLIVRTTGNATFSGATGAATPLRRFAVDAKVVTLGSVTVDGALGSAIDVVASQNICLNCSGVAPVGPVLVSHGAPVTFVANPTGTAVGSRGMLIINASIDAGDGDITMTGTGGSNAAINDHGVELNNTTLKTTGSGRITLTGTGRGIGGRGVSLYNPVSGSSITTVDGDITITGTGSGSSVNANSADVTWSGYAEDRLQATGNGTVRLIGLGTSDFNGVSIGTVGVALDADGPALNRWNVSSASNLFYSGLGVAKTSAGETTWTVRAPNSIEFLGSAGIAASQGKLNVVLAPVSGAVQLGGGSFSTHGGDFTIAGGTNPASLVDALLPPTGATGTSAYPAGITLNASTIDAGGGSIRMIGTGRSGSSQGYGIVTNQSSATTLRTSGTGDITLRGFGGGATAGSFNTGVFLGTGLVETTGSGSIDITGTASDSATGAYNWGIRQFVYNEIRALGNGSITLWGHSGNSATGDYNPGLEAVGTIAGHGGAVTLTGGAGDGPAAKNVGVIVLGKLSNTGSGGLTITGSGGSNAGTTSSQNAGVALSDAVVSTVDGDLVITGSGGRGGGSGNDGVVTPLAGVSGYGGANSISTSGSGNLVITGSAGPGGTGVVDSRAGMVTTTGSGAIFLSGDSVAFGTAGTLTSAAGISIRPITAGTPLNVGSAAAATGGLALDDATLGRFSWSPDSALTLGSAGTGATTVNTAHVFAQPLVVVSGAGADLTLAGTLRSGAAGSAPSIVLSAGRNFINSAGANAIDSASSPWRVYSTDPAADVRGGLAADFKQYDASFGVTPVLGSGNGALYRVAPTLTVGLAGNVAKIYDGGTSATLLPANLSVSGTIDGDTITTTSTGAGYDSRDAGDAKAVTASGLAFSASNGSIPVYGYRLASATATASVGTITPAPLVVRADDRSRLEGQPEPPLGATISGFAGADTAGSLDGALLLATTALPSSPPGMYTISASGLSARNYAIRYIDGAYQVLAAPIVGVPPVTPPVPPLSPTPVPSSVVLLPTLGQRDLRLVSASTGSTACVLTAIGSAPLARAIEPSVERPSERPLELIPRCAVGGVAHESR